MLEENIKIWLSFLFFHYSWKIELIQFYAHAECHGHGAKYAPFRKKQNSKGRFFLRSSQNYTDVEIKNPETTCQKLFGENLFMLFSLCHSQIYKYQKVHACSILSSSATPWTVTCQAPLSMRFSRQEYWCELPFPTPRDLPDSGIKPTFLASPALAGGFFTTNATWEAQIPKQPPSKQYNGQSCSLMMPFSPACVQTLLSQNPFPYPVIWSLSAFSEHTPLVHL